MTKQKKMLMLLIVMTGMFQMPNVAISSAVNTMVTEVFVGHTLAEIQTSMAITGIISPISSLLTAFLIRKSVLTKRTVVIFGLTMLGITGLLSAFIHAHFWCLAVLAVSLGLSSGCYVSTSISLMMDYYNTDERRKLSGLHSVFVGFGGILLSVVGGLLVKSLWYAGYLLLLIGFPLAIYAFISIPRKGAKNIEVEVPAPTQGKSKLNRDIFYYIVFVGIFMVFYNVGASNISTHLDQNGIENFSMYAGFATGAQMAGTMVLSMFFNKLSKKFGDMLMAIAFASVFVGFTVLNIFSSSIVMMFVGLFIMGMSMPCLGPQCVLSISKRVDDSTSALASSFANGIAPGLGSFLSPVIITNTTIALGGNSTNFRYQFTAFAALAVAVLLFFLTRYRNKKFGDKYN